MDKHRGTAVAQTKQACVKWMAMGGKFVIEKKGIVERVPY